MHRHFFLDQIVKAPTVKAPKAPRAKAPRAPKPPDTEKPPKVPGVQNPSAKKEEGGGVLQRAGEGMRRLGEFHTYNQLMGLSEGLKRSDSTENLRFLGTRSRDYGTSEGAKKRSQHQVAAENHRGAANREQAVGYGPTRKSLAHTTAANAHQQAHSLMGKPGYAAAAAKAHAASRRAWGDSTSDYGTVEGARTRALGRKVTPQAKEQQARKMVGVRARIAAREAGTLKEPQQERSSEVARRRYGAYGQTPSAPDDWKPNRTTWQSKTVQRSRAGDAGTSEGAKKAAATRRQGATERTVRKGGNYGVDIKAGSNVKRADPRPPPEPYRGYDSRGKR